MRNRKNVPLWIGGFMVALLVLIAAIGPYIAPYDPAFQEKMRNEVVNGKTVIIKLPLPPSSAHWLGTDKWGYDLLTLLLHGAPYTIFVTMAISFLRVVLGTLAGLYLGTQEQEQRWWISIENAWSYIPIFIPVYFLLQGININPELSTSTLVAIFIGMVTLLGIPSVVSSIRQKTQQIRETQYVLASVALGAGRNQIIFRHILPHLKEQIALIFVMEIIATMTLMGLLGMFDLFVGGTIMTFDPVITHSVTHEWAGLLGSYRSFLYTSYTWIYLAPLGAFMLVIASFSLLAKGLRNRYQSTYQRTPFI
jgi:peptide/nickel transport system permease protein